MFGVIDMKLITIVMLLVPMVAVAGNTEIVNTPLGSGAPGSINNEPAFVVQNDIYHAPQYMPGFPTAATIWPRIVKVKCQKTDDTVVCDGYNWSPAMGRGEYLFFVPHFEPTPTPLATPEPIIIERIVKVPVLIEVSHKKKSE
jgi:hypothetical protein